MNYSFELHVKLSKIESKLTSTLQGRHLSFTWTCTATYVSAFSPVHSPLWRGIDIASLFFFFFLPLWLTVPPFNSDRWGFKYSLGEQQGVHGRKKKITHRENTVFSTELEVLTVVVSMWGITQPDSEEIILTAHFNLYKVAGGPGLLSQNNSDSIRKISILNWLSDFPMFVLCQVNRKKKHMCNKL